MPILARQTVSESGKVWVKKEAQRLNVSQAEIIRRLIDAMQAKNLKVNEL